MSEFDEVRSAEPESNHASDAEAGSYTPEVSNAAEPEVRIYESKINSSFDSDTEAKISELEAKISAIQANSGYEPDTKIFELEAKISAIQGSSSNEPEASSNDQPEAEAAEREANNSYEPDAQISELQANSSAEPEAENPADAEAGAWEPGAKKLAFPENRIRIKDIAVLANVSAGTVDRVIHNRGGVAPENKKRIEDILNKLNFKPNKMARVLAIKKDYRLVVLLPQAVQGDYWWDVIKGIKRAEEEVSDYRVKTEILQFNQYSIESFATQTQRLLEINPDGVLMAPFFRREVLQLTKVLEERSIPVVFVDSNVESVSCLAYYGQQSHQSGFVAAKIMLSNLEPSSTVLMVHMLREGNEASGSNQTAKREEGFLAYIEKYSLDSTYQLIRVNLHANDDSGNEEQLDEIFRQNQNIRGIVMFNSRIYRIADFLEARKIRNIRIIGYDLLERNVHYLKNGMVECLIAQRPQLQGYYGLTALARHLAFHQPSKPVCYMPIDILFKENISDYKVYPFDVD
ncbi:MAG: LacI family DNA-binding transcriptional regulator [Prevotellaceae bacterium]|jgi:LacI family transcriptional regulator|nr:LacI family DNA-binding transcriptional regulator [Prevotellaceae bacterium]